MPRFKRFITCRTCGNDIRHLKGKIYYCSETCREAYRVKYLQLWYQANKVRENRRRTVRRQQAKARQELEALKQANLKNTS